MGYFVLGPASADASVALAPGIVSRELHFAVFSIFQRRNDSHAKSGGVGFFEDVLVFDETEKELLAYVASPENVWEGSLLASGETKVSKVERSNGGVVERSFPKASFGKFAIAVGEGSTSSSRVADVDFDDDFHRVTGLEEAHGWRRVGDKSSFYFTRSGIQVSAFQIKDADFSDLDLGFCDFDLFFRGFGGSFGGFGGNSGVLNAFAHVAELPEKQTGLGSADDHEPEGKKAGGVARNPVPEGAMALMSLVACCALAGGITLGWLATR
jgi:hypothetical protein